LGTEATGREDIVDASVTGIGSGVRARWSVVAAAAVAVVGLVLLVWTHLVRARPEKVTAAAGPHERDDGRAESP